jgi:hypothetical protein
MDVKNDACVRHVTVAGREYAGVRAVAGERGQGGRAAAARQG